MFDHFAIHIGHIQPAVGSDRHLHGAEPDIFGANKLGVLIDPVAAIRDAVAR